MEQLDLFPHVKCPLCGAVYPVAVPLHCVYCGTEIKIYC